MKQKKTIKNITKAILLLSVLTLTFCGKGEELVTFSDQGLITKDSEVISLMMEVVGASESHTKSDFATDQNNSCTDFRYPISFYLNEELAQAIVINSDEEFIDFVNSLQDDQYFNIYFPITLLDTDGEETIIYNLEELKGTLIYALDACDDVNDDDDDDSDDDYDYEYCDKNGKKVYICHKGNTICVSVNAIWGHINQHDEDYLGQCND
jgi:hypothetical protein